MCSKGKLRRKEQKNIPHMGKCKLLGIALQWNKYSRFAENRLESKLGSTYKEKLNTLTDFNSVPWLWESWKTTGGRIVQSGENHQHCRRGEGWQCKKKQKQTNLKRNCYQPSKYTSNTVIMRGFICFLAHLHWKSNLPKMSKKVKN